MDSNNPNSATSNLSSNKLFTKSGVSIGTKKNMSITNERAPGATLKKAGIETAI